MHIIQTDDTIYKCNQTAQKVLNDGHENFKSNNYRAALECYNESLCFAEIGTASQSIVFVYENVL